MPCPQHASAPSGGEILRGCRNRAEWFHRNILEEPAVESCAWRQAQRAGTPTSRRPVPSAVAQPKANLQRRDRPAVRVQGKADKPTGQFDRGKELRQGEQGSNWEAKVLYSYIKTGRIRATTDPSKSSPTSRARVPGDCKSHRLRAKGHSRGCEPIASPCESRCLQV